MRLKYWLLGLLASISMIGSFLVVTAQPAYADCGGGVQNLLPGATSCSVSTCAYENLGWVICPVLRASASAADNAFTFVNQNFMKIEVGLTDRNSGAAQAGAMIRNIANVLFVLVMLVIIYTFVTGQGVSNYNLKRLAPRFIVAVILVQASFYVCQIFVDFSNIAGVTARQLLVDNVAKSIGPSAMPLADEAGKNDTETLSKLVSGVVAKEEIAWPLLAPLAAVVMSIAIVTSVIIVILIIRKVVVVALVLLAPLAFVAYLLPNTSDYFSKWLRMFIYTLMLFPVISILIGTGQIVSASILRTGASDYKVKDDSIAGLGRTANGSATLYLVAAGAAVLPLAGTWYAFKIAMSAFDAAGSMVNQRGSRRTAREREEDVKKREQTAMDMNKKSMMMRGINRLQQLNVTKDGESTASIFGRAGAYRGRGKHQTKSPEQARFDNQVQQRLSELRGDTSGRSPQELYSQALQRYQDRVGEDSGDVNINSYEGIDLKASEAYLLESLGKGIGASSSLNVAMVAPGGVDDKKDTDKKPAGNSSLDRSKSGDGGNGQTAQDPYRPPQVQGVQSQPTGEGATAGAAAVIVQQTAVPGAEAGAVPSGDLANGTGFAPRRPVQTDNELLAKARAARYVAGSQDTDESIEDIIIDQSHTNPPRGL